MQIGRRTLGKWVGRLAVATCLVAVTGLPAQAVDEGVGAGGFEVTAVGTPVVGFDAVGTQSEKHGWKHLGLRKGLYVIFDDGGLIESGAIASKWRFLPGQFTFGVDAASIVFVGSKWKYTFVKGSEAIVFFDSGIVAGPLPYASLWPTLPPEMASGMDSLTEHSENGRFVHLVTAGENFQIFNDGGSVLAQGLIRTRWSFLPVQFLSNLDDASIEPENGGWKISFYKNNERIVFQDTGQVFEDRSLTDRWPFLRSFLQS